MNPEIAELKDHEIIKLAGELTIERAEELRKMLGDKLERTERLFLSFAEVTEVDVSFLQLLCSAHRTALKVQKCFWIDKDRPEALRSAIKEAGFVREQGCNLDFTHNCLWKEGWE
jgi:anti-anti-sigma regulatory factor